MATMHKRAIPGRAGDLCILLATYTLLKSNEDICWLLFRSWLCFIAFNAALPRLIPFSFAGMKNPTNILSPFDSRTVLPIEIRADLCYDL